jgi:hypothetical protein
MTEYMEYYNIKNKWVPHRELRLHNEDQLGNAEDGNVVGCDCVFLGK